MPAPSNAVKQAALKEQQATLDQELLSQMREQAAGWQTATALASIGLWRIAFKALPTDLDYRFIHLLRRRADEFDKDVIYNIPYHLRNAMTFACTGSFCEDRPEQPVVDEALRILFAIAAGAQKTLNASTKEGTPT